MVDRVPDLVLPGAGTPGQFFARWTWELVDEDALDGPTSWFRVALLVLQGVAIVVVLVLCAPTSERCAMFARLSG